MSHWFRMYNEILDDPKVQRLPAEDFRVWVNLLCLASRNEGRFGNVSETAFSLRMSEDGALTVLERLLNAGLIDRLSGGADGWHYAPHAWDKRQYKSDTSTERVKRFRKRSETATATPPDTDTDQSNTVAKATAASGSPDKIFWDSAKEYLGASKASLIGKWASEFGRPAVVSAILAAQVERPIDKAGYIAGILRKGKTSNGPAIPI